MSTDTKPEALRLSDALENGTYLLSVERVTTAAELRRLHHENADLRAQLEAIGAGGVEPLRKRGCLHHIEEPLVMVAR